VLWFYGGLKFQPAFIALFQQADCQPAHDLGRLNHQPAPARCLRACLLLAQVSQACALGLRTTRVLDSMDVLFGQWYLGG
jgi:hypothetical protein